jgi:TPR repeat protein
MISSAIRGSGETLLSLAGLALLGILSIAPAPRAAAQASSDQLVVDAPAAFQLAPGAEAALPIQISPGAAVPRRAIVLIRGLPSTASLSEGRLFESGVWGVAAGDLGRLKISAASGANGRNELDISVVAIDGTVLAEGHSSLVIGALASANTPNDKTMYTAASSQTDVEIAKSAPPPQRLSPAQAEQYVALVKKGDEQLRVGNISAARLLYRHAAEAGLAAGALALAATYDEVELKKLRVVGGVQADPKQARLWYESAAGLGSAEAQERLQRFGAR